MPQSEDANSNMASSPLSRRNFLRAGTAATSLALAPTFFVRSNQEEAKSRPGNGRAKNVIFLVSDGMSVGTLSMADQLLRRRDGRRSNWLRLIDEAAERGIRSCKMDMASANSLVTDSAAAASAWGCGHRVNNGSVNMGADGRAFRPVLEAFAAAGKSTGLVTTTSLTHATPAGFGANVPRRGMEEEIAVQYLERRYDLLLGGGERFFAATSRSDGRSIFTAASDAGYNVVRDRSALQSHETGDRRLLGVFSSGHLPYSLDRGSSVENQIAVPTLSEMTDIAVRRLSRNRNGFIVMIEGGRVDHAAHSNDVGGLLYDQIAFDDAVGVATAFAENRDDTLVIITTDHGNANPGLNGVSGVNQMFDRILEFRQTNSWINSGLGRLSSTGAIRDRIHEATGIGIERREARILQDSLRGFHRATYRVMSRPNQVLGQILANYVGVNFVGGQHTSDYVELLAFGPGSESLSGFARNTDLFNLMTVSGGVRVEA
jgi:alkaline phosphatase